MGLFFIKKYDIIYIVINERMNNMIGIYMYKNKIDGKVYIG